MSVWLFISVIQLSHIEVLQYFDARQKFSSFQETEDKKYQPDRALLPLSLSLPSANICISHWTHTHWVGLGPESWGHKMTVAPVLMKHRITTLDGVTRTERAGSLGCFRAAARTVFQNPAQCSTPAQRWLCVLSWVSPRLFQAPSPWCLSNLCSGLPRCTCRSLRHRRPCWKAWCPPQLVWYAWFCRLGLSVSCSRKPQPIPGQN